MHRTRRALLATLLVAVAVSMGLVLSAVPNVELLSFTVFLSGFLLGPRYGATVGIFAAALFSTFNPLGAGLPPLVVAQAVGQAVTGVAGGSTGARLAEVSKRTLACLLAGGLGLALTLFYDVLTSVGAYVTIAGEKSIQGLVKFVAGGLLFAGLHIVWNTALFSLALVPTLRVLGKFREELTDE
jgi:hypothetical protein